MLDGKPVPGARVVVIDFESYHVGASLALRLAGQGHEVTLATPSETVAAWCNWTLEGPRLREQLHAAGVVMRSDVTPEAIVPRRRAPRARLRRRRRSRSRPTPSCS